MKKRRKKSKIGKTGCLFWLLILLIVVIIFLYKGKGSIKETINYFKNFIAKNKTEEIIKKQKEIDEKKKQKPERKPETNKKLTIEETKESEKTEEKPEKTVTNTYTKTRVSSESKKTASKIKSKTLIKSIYFIKIELDGSAKPYPVKRKIQYKDSPITMTIKMLLKGPNPSERKKGIISFIPNGTQLLSASIKNGNLVLNFNNSIENNYSGRDAIMLEIAQILYTCFEFDTVKSVSILIDGKRKQYLTGEGIPLKSKYNRSDLSKIWD